VTEARPRIAIVGAGVVGTALGFALRGAGHAIVAVASRSEASARRAVERIGEGRVEPDLAVAARAADTVLVTVPDRAIEEVAARLAAGGRLPDGWLGLHTSGYHASDALAALREAGGAVGSVHPLQSFAGVDEALERIPGTRFFYEGDEPERIRRLVEALGGIPVELDPARKPLYHAAAATASNLLVTVVDLALAIGESAGLDRDELLGALLPLISGSVRNLETLGLPRALTGPISRGDVATLAGHLEALRREAPELLGPYVALARRTVDLAGRKGGLDGASRDAMREMLKNVEAPGGGW
jgi:predicted short-subunit dehydrogenase-like oxidoreductase (DUF2520 family)